MADVMPGSGLWLRASLILAVLGANLAWLATRGPGWTRPTGRLGALVRGPGGPAVGWLVSALYLLLPPFIAWRAGAISPYLLGLTGTDWPAMLGAPGLLAAGIAVLAVGGWLVFRRSRRTMLVAEAVGETLAGGGVRDGTGPLRWMAPLDAGLYQWHLAFYRAIAIGWVATTTGFPTGVPDRLSFGRDLAAQLMQAWHGQPLYWGSWLGLLPIALEVTLNPFAWRSVRSAGRREGAMRSIGLAIATTALFSLTRNFWLCLFCTLIVEIMIARWFPAER